MLVQGSWGHLATPLPSMCQQVNSINSLILLIYDTMDVMTSPNIQEYMV